MELPLGERCFILRCNDGLIYKTQHEWTQETGLTRTEQETARKRLKELGFLTEIKKGVPCKIYFKVEREKLYKALIEYSETLDSSQYAENLQSSMQETCELGCGKPAIYYREYNREYYRY